MARDHDALVRYILERGGRKDGRAPANISPGWVDVAFDNLTRLAAKCGRCLRWVPRVQAGVAKDEHGFGVVAVVGVDRPTPKAECACG